MALVRRSIVAAKLERIARHAARAKGKLPAGPEEFLASEDVQDIVLHNLQPAIEACVGLAGHIVSDEGWLTPGSDLGLFERLRYHGVIDAPLAEAMARAVRLRNVMVHGYERLDLARLWRESPEGPASLDRFARAVAACYAP